MTVYCPLNKPQCKRSIMTGRGSFSKLECPLSKPAKCLLAPEICPMIPQPEGQCFLEKIQDVAAKGCPASPQGGTKCCSRFRGTQQQRKRNDSFEMAEKPPCTRCSVGNVEPTKISNPKISKNKSSRQDESFYTETVKEEVVRSPKNLAQKQPSTRKKVKNEMDPNALQDTREKIYSDAITAKTEQLKKTRNHLLVPQCSLASRRPLPCASCLLELLNQSNSSTTKDTSRVYNKAEFPCPFMKMMSLCGDKCICPEVPPLDDEEEECPFLAKKTRTPVDELGYAMLEHKLFTRCALNRVRSNPLVLDTSRIADRGQPFDTQKCPVVPGNCCYSAPSCKVHTELLSTVQKAVSCFCS